MNLFVSTTFFEDKTSINEALITCKKFNIKNIELGSNHCFSDNYESILKKHNFNYIMHNYFPIPKNSFVLNLASSNDDIYKMSINHAKNAIDLCKKINSKLYTIHPGFLSDPNGSNISSDNYDFQWDNSHKKNYNRTFEKMIKGITEVVDYAKKFNINIAIETEGSLNKSNHLLMQKPNEFELFFKYFSSSDIGINLNIGHLNLSKNLFEFNTDHFIDLIQDYIIAMELSHNNGIEDEHLPLVNNQWYWNIIMDERFKNSYKILEFRNTKIQDLIENMKLFKKNYDKF